MKSRVGPIFVFFDSMTEYHLVKVANLSFAAQASWVRSAGRCRRALQVAIGGPRELPSAVIDFSSLFEPRMGQST
jgi:hypothetical protein